MSLTINCENDNCNSIFILHKNGYKCVNCDRKICKNCSDKGYLLMDAWDYGFTCEKCLKDEKDYIRSKDNI